MFLFPPSQGKFQTQGEMHPVKFAELWFPLSTWCLHRQELFSAPPLCISLGVHREGCAVCDAHRTSRCLSLQTDCRLSMHRAGLILGWSPAAPRKTDISLLWLDTSICFPDISAGNSLWIITCLVMTGCNTAREDMKLPRSSQGAQCDLRNEPLVMFKKFLNFLKNYFALPWVESQPCFSACEVRFSFSSSAWGAFWSSRVWALTSLCLRNPG